MNDLLQLRGTFDDAEPRRGGAVRNLPANAFIMLERVTTLIADLKEVEKYWKDIRVIPNVILSIQYRQIISKSNRIQEIFSMPKIEPNKTVVGARFNKAKNKHIITHYITRENLRTSIDRLRKVEEIFERVYGTSITTENIKLLNDKSAFWADTMLSKKDFISIIVDSYYVEKIFTSVDVDDVVDMAIVTLYDTATNSVEVLRSLDIQITADMVLDNTTVRLTPDLLERLKSKAPYLISMEVVDLSLFRKEDFKHIGKLSMNMPSPTNEPVIGVIDTMFDESVYFAEWVDFENRLSPDIKLEPNDFSHGTAVASIIVDGPSINKDLDDGCGRFRVKHFGVATAKRSSTFTILREIKKIIAENPSIKVWNLSLGSEKEVNANFISPEASFLDQLQHENDVVFVVSATNKEDAKTTERVGAPADSINSLVVNAVNFKGEPTTYAREGPVLEFFQKPDVSYYGGDKDKGIRVCTNTGENVVSGTSFAAPWIARKLAYLIEVMKITREEAKALLIDAASGWETKATSKLGFGVVPIHINDIVKSKSNEIKFILSQATKKNAIYNYNVPVPVNDDKFPYIAKATICYFSPCSRKQGVDYTNAEVSVQFGRFDDRNERPKIASIDRNMQHVEGYRTYEEVARKNFGKWDCIKQVRDSSDKKRGLRPKEVFSKRGTWGLSLTALGRLDNTDREDIKVGIVITLKELNNVNRIRTFIQQCNHFGWRVHTVNVEERVRINNLANQEIKFDE